MILGNTSKIRNFDLDILSQLVGTSYAEAVVAPKTLQVMLNFVQKYNMPLGVVQCSSKILAFIVGDELPARISETLNLQPYSTYIFYIYNNGRSDFKREEFIMVDNSLQAFIIANYENSFKGATAIINSTTGTQFIKVQTVEYINKYGILEKIEENIEQFKSKKSGYSTDEKVEYAILVGVGRQDIDSSLDELQSLCLTAGINVIGRFSQTRKMPDKNTYVGVGKVQELSELVQSQNANLIVIDDEISGRTKSILEEELGVKVIDRSMLILDIFAKHASSSEGRLQVSLAQLKYSYSRLNAYQTSEGRFGGGAGMRGPGETKLVLAKKLAKERIYKAERELEKLQAQRELRRQNRKKNNEKIVSIVGYTNAGKSTLLNMLTKSTVLAEDKLFATLDTTTRELYLSPDKKVLLTDTVGFINKLPHEFIDAFASTLEETTQADLLLIVLDISSPNAIKQYEIVQTVLKKINANNIPQIIVGNKIDAQNKVKLQINSPIIEISARKGIGLEKLKDAIISKLF